MANLFDYLAWRGDLPFDLIAPGEADKLILAQLSYILFDGHVPALNSGSVPLREASQAVLAQGQDGAGVHQIGYMWRENQRLLEVLPDTSRYRNLTLFGYESDLKEDMQFGALTIRLSEDLICVSFRGTDDTLIGWKEDCALAFPEPVPAQIRSAEYLSRVAQHHQGNILVTGHSKGGNLAVYAAAMVPQKVQDRIVCVVSCDGPGLDKSILQTEGYSAIRGKIEKFVPQSSIVGMLLENEDNYTVVRSDGVGLLQHSAFTWQMMGDRLVRQSQPTQTSRYINHVIKAWLDDMDVEKRKTFVEALFEVIRTTNLTSVDQINARFLFNLPAAMLKVWSIDPKLRVELFNELRELVLTALKTLAQAGVSGIENLTEHSTEEMKNLDKPEEQK